MSKHSSNSFNSKGMWSDQPCDPVSTHHIDCSVTMFDLVSTSQSANQTSPVYRSSFESACCSSWFPSVPRRVKEGTEWQWTSRRRAGIITKNYTRSTQLFEKQFNGKDNNIEWEPTEVWITVSGHITKEFVAVEHLFQILFITRCAPSSSPKWQPSSIDASYHTRVTGSHWA